MALVRTSKAHKGLMEKQMYEDFVSLTSDNKASEMAVTIIGYYIDDDVIRYENAKRYQINKTAEINAENTLKVHGLQLFTCMVDTMTDWHSETLYKYYCHNTTHHSKRRKNVLFIPLTNL